MVIWTIFAILCTVATGVFGGLTIANYIEKKKKYLRRNITIALLAVALCITSFMTIYYGTNDRVGDGKVVAFVYEQNEDTRYPIYYSEKQDEYFIIETNLYNVMDLAERTVVDKEIAEQYIETYKHLHSIDLKGETS